ncbi:ABC-type transporter ATP-binding protein EcsA [compost metagenome]
MKEKGAAILMSSHILSTVESYCDRFIVMHHGKIAAQGTLEAVKLAAGMERHGGTLEDAFYRLVTGGNA